MKCINAEKEKKKSFGFVVCLKTCNILACICVMQVFHIYFFMFQDLRRRGKQIQINKFPFIALSSSNQQPSQASLTAWLSLVLKFESLVQNQLWFHCYRTTRLISFIISSFVQSLQHSFRQSQRASFIATGRILSFLSKFRIFLWVTQLFWNFNKHKRGDIPTARIGESGNQPKPGSQSLGMVVLFVFISL